MSNPFHIFILAGSILAIKAIWIFTDHTPLKKKFSKELIKSNLIELVILVLQVLNGLFFPWPSTRFDTFLVIFGLGMYTFGLALALSARIIQQDNWGHPGIQLKNIQKDLVTEGPFTLSRNPIYLGWIMIYLGFCIAIRSWLIVLRIPMIIYFYKSIIREEKLLEKQFGKKYRSYKATVPRFLLW